MNVNPNLVLRIRRLLRPIFSWVALVAGLAALFCLVLVLAHGHFWSWLFGIAFSHPLSMFLLAVSLGVLSAIAWVFTTDNRAQTDKKDSASEGSHRDIFARQIASELAELEWDVSFWRPRAFLGHITIAILSALVTVIAGLKGGLPKTLASSDYIPQMLLERDNWVLVLSGAIAVISAWQAFYRHRDRWVGYDAAANQLYALQAKLELEPANVSLTRIAELSKEFADIMSTLNRAELATTARDDKR